MAKYTINLLERYKESFGFLPANVVTRAVPGVSRNNIFGNIAVFTVGDVSFSEMSLKGADLELTFGSLPFTGGNFGLLSSIVRQEEVTGKFFAPPPMVSFSRSKNMSITEIDGTDNEVIELFGLKSWNIRMQGLLVDMEEHTYPSQQEEMLHKLFAASEIFEVSGEMFTNKNITSLYFTRIDIASVAGFPDTLKYTLLARSIKPAEFQLLNKSN